MKSYIHVGIAAIVACGYGGATFAAGASTYHVVDLGLVQAPERAVVGLNNPGQAVGVADIDSRPTCVLYDHGASTLLSAPGGPSCYVSGINDAATVVGFSLLTDGSNNVHAFVYQHGVMTDLGTAPGDTSSEAVAINNGGTVVGTSSTPIHSAVYTYKDGKAKRVAPPANATDSYAGAINDQGHVTGSAMYASPYPKAFLSRKGVATDLGTLNNDAYNSQSEGLGINAKSQVVGWSSGATFRQHAMVYMGGRMLDLGVLPAGSGLATSVAFGINNAGTIVGMSDDGGGVQVAFVYTDNQMIDLNTLLDEQSGCWSLVRAQAINQSGQITGIAWSSNDQQMHVFLATPDN